MKKNVCTNYPYKETKRAYQLCGNTQLACAFVFEYANKRFSHDAAETMRIIAANNNEKFRSFKSEENNHKKEVGPYRGFGY